MCQVYNTFSVPLRLTFNQTHGMRRITNQVYGS